MPEETVQPDMLNLTADIVAAYVSNNSVPRDELGKLVADVQAALASLGKPVAPPVLSAPKPAVPVRKSVTDDHIICLEDGKRFKSLKRHLATRYNMTPDEYRAKWKLPADYPMVAPGYAAARSRLAKQIGFGQKLRKGMGGDRRTPAG